MSEKPKPFVFEDSGEAKRFAPATLRNRDAIADVLRDILPASGSVLEIASGTGEHIVHFAQQFAGLEWQPSDPDPSALASIEAWSAESGLANISAPLQIDTTARDWPVDAADVILCCNMIHIAPWEATIGLMRGAGQLLTSGGLLYLYGPFREADRAFAQSNADFDVSLKSRNAEWGIRLLSDVENLANRYGLSLKKRIEMPANNLSLIFGKD